MTAADAPLTDDERAQGMTISVLGEVTDHWFTSAAVESILLVRETALRETIAQEIEAQRVPYTLQETAGRCWALGQQDAARIVRGQA